MSSSTIVADAFLTAGVLAEVLCVVGVFWMQDVFDQLHYAAASSTIGPALIAVAVGITGFSSPSGTIEDLVAIVALMLLNPVLSHATARLAWKATGGDTAEDTITAQEAE